MGMIDWLFKKRRENCTVGNWNKRRKAELQAESGMKLTKSEFADALHYILDTAKTLGVGEVRSILEFLMSFKDLSDLMSKTAYTYADLLKSMYKDEDAYVRVAAAMLAFINEDEFAAMESWILLVNALLTRTENEELRKRAGELLQEMTALLSKKKPAGE